MRVILFEQQSVCLSRNHWLKIDFLKTNIFPRIEASRANIVRPSNFQGATVRPIVPDTLSVFIVHH